jgi:hypothetical protein
MKTKTTAKFRRTARKEKTPLFVTRAERAFKKVAVVVREEHARHGLKPLVWKS